LTGYSGKECQVVSVDKSAKKEKKNLGLREPKSLKILIREFFGSSRDIAGKTIGIRARRVKPQNEYYHLEIKSAVVVEASAYRLEPAGIAFLRVLENVDASSYEPLNPLSFRVLGRKIPGIRR